MSGIDIRFSDDFEKVIIYTLHRGTCTEWSYSISDLRPYASTIQPLPQSAAIHTLNYTTVSVNMPLTEELDARTTFYQQYIFSQWWQTFAGVPMRYSYIALHLSVERAGDADADAQPHLRRTWHVSQHYLSDAHARAEERRFAFALGDPVVLENTDLEHGLPLMGVSFNHAAWIDQEPVVALYRRTRRKKRVLRLVSFPEVEQRAEPSGCEAKFVTLDVPEDVLNSAYHLFVEPTLCSIVITTSTAFGCKNEIHTFPYA